MTLSQVEGAVLVLFIPLVYLIFASSSERRHQQSTYLEAFPVVGFRDEWFHSVRGTFRSLFKTTEWSLEGYTKVIDLKPVRAGVKPSDLLRSSLSVVLPIYSPPWTKEQ